MSTSPSSVVGAAVQIDEVEAAPRTAGLHANLERPAGEEAVTGFCVPLSGWALAPDGAHVAIEVGHGRQVLRRLARSVERTDIAEAFPDVAGAARSGFSLVLDVLKLPTAFDLRVSGAVGEAEPTPIARVRGSRRAFEPLPVDGPAPLTVTTLGRTGSTLMMTLLSVHPAIAAFNPVGYDARPFAYQLEAALAMASPASRMRLLDSAAQGDTWWLGRELATVEAFQRLDPPLRELLLGAPVEQLLRAAVDRAAAFTRELGAAQQRPDVRYAAEKSGPAHLPRLMRELCADGREIFLVRDFRDVLASMLAFNTKRGYAAFGREQVDSDEQFVRRLGGHVAALAAGWRERSDGALLVRYEELVADPAATLAGVLDYLELESSASEVAGLVERAQALTERTRLQHRTVQEAAASTGRWQSDLPPELQELAVELFADPLRELGYE
ncbi:MAG TPA: sulfotransferase [Conexibacter sp.]|nr:sulfotransferase [Conexibacter sp.]